MTELIATCLKGDRVAQKRLYEHFKDKMFVLCLRYADSREDAKDILQEGFIKLFRDLHQFKGLGSFEGWARKVFLNVALQHLKKKKAVFFEPEGGQWDRLLLPQEEEPFDEDLVKNILHLMQRMPTGFRTVLNLYVMEEHSHQEIADILGISVGTSKSQLLRAKVYLRELVDKTLTR